MTPVALGPRSRQSYGNEWSKQLHQKRDQLTALAAYKPFVNKLSHCVGDKSFVVLKEKK